MQYEISHIEYSLYVISYLRSCQDLRLNVYWWGDVSKYIY